MTMKWSVISYNLYILSPNFSSINPIQLQANYQSNMVMQELQTYTIFFLLWLAATLLLRLLFSSSSGAGYRLPPCPASIPILGHLHLLSPIPHQALHKLSLRHGPLMRLLLGSVPCVVASDADTAKLFLKTHDADFASRPYSAAVHYLTYGSADFSFAPYGPYWKFMKKLCMSELLGGRMLDHLLHVRREEVRRLVDGLRWRSGESVDMGGELLRATNNVISRMTMGRTCTGETAGEADEVRRLVEEVSELTGKFNLSDYIGLFKNMDVQGFGRRCKKVQERFDAMMNKIIAEKQEKMMRKKTTSYKEGTDEELLEKDILDRLLDIADDEEAEMKITRENIKAFILVHSNVCL